MPSLFDSGIRPAIDAYLEAKSKEIRNYGDYWSASSAGYCMRKLVFERLGVPPVKKEGDERKTRVFEAGHIFHKFIQDITKGAGLSIAQELELQDDDLMVRGHIDDLIMTKPSLTEGLYNQRLILYDYKTQHANAFAWQKGRPISYFHRLQVGTYMYMLLKLAIDHIESDNLAIPHGEAINLEEARILKISKDDLRMDENQVLWDETLEKEVLDYWTTLNQFWAERKMPKCTCKEVENGFMAKEAFNPYWFDGEPCSLALYFKFKEETANVG